MSPYYFTKTINLHHECRFFLCLFKKREIYLHISKKCCTFAAEIVFNIKNTNESIVFIVKNTNTIFLLIESNKLQYEESN